MCGLTAMHMAAFGFLWSYGHSAAEVESTLNARERTVGALLQAAKENGYSYLGEMFSSHNCSALFAHFYRTAQPSHTQMYDFRAEVARFSLAALLQGVCTITSEGSRGAVLVPYDVAPNYQPGLLGGKKPHWGLVKGFFLYLRNDNEQSEIDLFAPHDQHVQTTEGTNVPLVNVGIGSQNEDFTLKVEAADVCRENEGHEAVWLTAVRCGVTRRFYVREEDVLLVCQHSKTRYQSIYWYPDLKQSNQNLRHFDTHLHPELLVPTEDPLQGLRGQMVVLACDRVNH